MAKFYDVVGYGRSTEIEPGIWDDVITERRYYGDVVKNSFKLASGESVNDNLSTGNSIRIMADDFAGEHFSAIKYVKWAGAFWEVTEVTEERPRLLLRLGGVYNGPKA